MQSELLFLTRVNNTDPYVGAAFIGHGSRRGGALGNR